MHRKTTLAIGLAAAVALAAPALAQQPAGPTVLTAHALRGGAYWVEGGVSNSGFVVGDKGVIVIDAQKSPDDAAKALAQIAKVTPKPVNAVVLTHSDPDHIGGLPAYPAGTEVFAQENTRSVMQVSMTDPNGGPVNGPLYKAVAGLLPKIHTVGATETLVRDGVRMVLIYVAPAHTSGDLIVYLPAQKIVFGGDIILTNLGPYPVIHIGGSSLGWMESVRAMLALDADTYVSGHGRMESKAMLRARLEGVERRRVQIKALVLENKTLAEVKQALGEPAANPSPFATFTESTYVELTKGYPPAQPPWANSKP
jgi:glyoxylase-like metal-dependent hydrolase (beta-lactamase superfamily II)